MQDRNTFISGCIKDLPFDSNPLLDILLANFMNSHIHPLLCFQWFHTWQLLLIAQCFYSDLPEHFQLLQTLMKAPLHQNPGPK